MTSSACQHKELLLDVSSFGLRSGFKRAPDVELAAAATEHTDVHNVRRDGFAPADSAVFPAPLVLPDDLLAFDEDDEPQTLHEYLHDENRNEPTAERKTIYLVRAPKIDGSVRFMTHWTKPTAMRTEDHAAQTSQFFEDIVKYITAWYHGMPVKVYKKPIKFTAQADNMSEAPDEIDMVFNKQLLGVRTRRCPDGAFSRQLNLNDMIDVLINLLPADAYAIMMLVDHDVWEDDEDDYTCGRAYGASRVSLVSTARYNPALDLSMPLDLQHAWPASHCLAYTNHVIADYEAEHGRSEKKLKKTTTSQPSKDSAIRSAVDSFHWRWLQAQATLDETTPMLWLSRVCKTASHELGHCIGIDHCSYYACLMQGTCNGVEDARQPPYLCPVDQMKLLHATKKSASSRHKALLDLFVQPDWREEPMFAAYRAWIRAVEHISPLDVAIQSEVMEANGDEAVECYIVDS